MGDIAIEIEKAEARTYEAEAVANGIEADFVEVNGSTAALRSSRLCCRC